MYPLTHAVLTNLSVSAPTGTFIAAKLAKLYGTTWTPPLTRPSFLKALGVPTNQGRPALRKLINQGVIQATRQHWHPGHPHYCFQLKPETAFPDGYDEFVQSPHQYKIQQLLEWNERPPEHRPHQLTIPQRVLLMILLARASSTGVVTGFSQRYLAGQLGVDERVVHKQTKNLKRYGYLRFTVDGGNFDRLLGRRPSVYFIELRHQAFQEHIPGGLTLIGARPMHPVATAFSNYRARQRTRNPSPVDEGLRQPDEDLVELIGSKPQDAEIHYLGWIIDALAIEILPNAKALGARPPEWLLENLYTQIADELPRAEGSTVAYRQMPSGYTDELQNAWEAVQPQPAQGTVSIDDAPFNFTLETDDRRSSAQAFLVMCVVQQAKLALNALHIKESQDTSSDILILPQPNGSLSSRRMAIETYATERSRTPHLIYVLLKQRFLPQRTDANPTAIDAISESLLEQTSLRTLPLAKPELKAQPSSYNQKSDLP